MVSQTRSKNKTARPAAPVMTEAAKVRAGIIPAKPRSKRKNKDTRIRELEARLAELERPDDPHPSKEPLFIRDESSEGEEPEVRTDPDSDNDVPGGKRSRGIRDPRALKRTKAYESLTDVRPTIRNKPAGLVNNWYEAATTPPPPQTSPPMHSYAHDPFMLHPMSQSHMGESSQFSLHQPFGQFQPIPTQVAGSLFSQPVDPMPLTFAGPDNSPWAHPVNPSLVRRENTVNEMEQARNSLSLDAALSHFPSQVISLPRPYINKDGEKRAVGIQDLPNAVRVGFRDSYIRRVIKLVFSSDTPWANPSIDVLQQEFNASFPNHCVKMHLDDAAAFPTIRDLGLLRCQIGREAINAVSQHLPSQYNKRQLDSKSARAVYIRTLVSDHKQYPYIWECFRPGNVPVGSAKLYYDDKRHGRFQSFPVLKAFSVYWSTYGIRTAVVPSDPGEGNRPIGALAMAAAAVERAYQMHQTGDFVQLPNDFSMTNWNQSTRAFLNIIENDLTDNDWNEIFESLYKFSKSQARSARAKVGAPTDEPVHEPLLPADPRTPPRA